jgi:hypothetical protein
MAAAAPVCQHCAVRARHIAFVLGAAAATSWSPLGTPVPSAAAQPCPDVEVVFARGTTATGTGRGRHRSRLRRTNHVAAVALSRPLETGMVDEVSSRGAL